MLRFGFPSKQVRPICARDHDTASKPDGDARPGSYVRRGRDGYSSAELPVEEERHGYLWRDLLELHHAGDDEL